MTALNFTFLIIHLIFVLLDTKDEDNGNKIVKHLHANHYFHIRHVSRSNCLFRLVGLQTSPSARTTRQNQHFHLFDTFGIVFGYAIEKCL